MRAKSAKGKTFINAELCKEVATAACLLFCAVTFLIFAVKKDFSKAGMAVLSVVYVMIPFAVERIFRFRIQAPLYFVIAFYTICPLLGYSYKLYYILPWWDDMQHAFAGLVFAMFGAYLPKVFLKDENCNIWLCVLCGFAVSMAIAGLWELVEYFFDSVFHTDMQKDTIIYRIDSYLLNERLYGASGELLTIPSVDATWINGEALEGYLDLGRQDSMIDMLVELAGTLLFCVVYLIDKGKRIAFHYLPQEEKTE